MSRVAVPRRVSKRLSKELCTYQRILAGARSRALSRGDTRAIVAEMLDRMFGFDSESEIDFGLPSGPSTGRLVIRDNSSPKLLVEVVAAGVKLSLEDRSRAITAATRHGASWAALTNGPAWRLYRVDAGLDEGAEEIASWDVFELTPRNLEHHALLFLICREGLEAAAIESRLDYVRAVNRYSISEAIQSAPALDAICSELRRASPGTEVSAREVRGLLSEILRRDLLESTRRRRPDVSFVRPTTDGELLGPLAIEPEVDPVGDGASVCLAYWPASSLRSTG